jgi:hypothetical protein
MDIVTEEDSVGIKFDEVYIPSAYCVEKAELEVSSFFGGFVVGGTCSYVFVGHINMPANSENTRTNFICILVLS